MYILTLISPGGGGGGGWLLQPPLDIFHDKSAARISLAARLHFFFPYRFAHILIPNLWRPGVRLQSYVTFSTCMSAWKSLKFVILCTNPMQIGILEVIHEYNWLLTVSDIWAGQL